MSQRLHPVPKYLRGPLARGRRNAFSVDNHEHNVPLLILAVWRADVIPQCLEGMVECARRTPGLAHVPLLTAKAVGYIMSLSGFATPADRDPPAQEPI